MSPILRSFTALALLFSLSVHAFTPAEIETVFPAQTGLTGAVTKLENFNLTIVTNQTHALFSLDQTRGISGWMAVGVGNAMADAGMSISTESAMSTQKNKIRFF